jgi:hypothetical protein
VRYGFTPRDVWVPGSLLHWGYSGDSAVGLHLPGGGKSQPDYGEMYLKCREHGNAFERESLERSTYPL